MRIRQSLAALALVVVLTPAFPTPAEAVTIRDIVELTRAGLSDDVIVALIDADRTIFVLDAKQILQLRNDGVSERVLLVMLESRSRYTSPASQVDYIPPPQPPVTERIVHVPVPVYLPSSPVVIAPRQTVVVEAGIQPGRFINDGYARRTTAPVETKSIWGRVAKDPRDIWRTPDPKPDPKPEKPPR